MSNNPPNSNHSRRSSGQDHSPSYDFPRLVGSSPTARRASGQNSYRAGWDDRPYGESSSWADRRLPPPPPLSSGSQPGPSSDARRYGDYGDRPAWQPLRARYDSDWDYYTRTSYPPAPAPLTSAAEPYRPPPRTEPSPADTYDGRPLPPPGANPYRPPPPPAGGDSYRPPPPGENSYRPPPPVSPSTGYSRPRSVTGPAGSDAYRPNYTASDYPPLGDYASFHHRSNSNSDYRPPPVDPYRNPTSYYGEPISPNRRYQDDYWKSGNAADPYFRAEEPRYSNWPGDRRGYYGNSGPPPRQGPPPPLDRRGPPGGERQRTISGNSSGSRRPSMNTGGGVIVKDEEREVRIPDAPTHSPQMSHGLQHSPTVPVHPPSQMHWEHPMSRGPPPNTIPDRPSQNQPPHMHSAPSRPPYPPANGVLSPPHPAPSAPTPIPITAAQQQRGVQQPGGGAAQALRGPELASSTAAGVISPLERRSLSAADNKNDMEVDSDSASAPPQSETAVNGPGQSYYRKPAYPPTALFDGMNPLPGWQTVSSPPPPPVSNGTVRPVESVIPRGSILAKVAKEKGGVRSESPKPREPLTIVDLQNLDLRTPSTTQSIPVMRSVKERDLPHISSAKTVAQALKVVVLTRQRYDTSSRVSRVEPILQANQAVADTTPAEQPHSGALVDSMMNGPQSKARLWTFVEIKNSMEKRLKLREERVKEKQDRLRKEYQTLHDKWVLHCARLDEEARVAEAERDAKEREKSGVKEETMPTSATARTTRRTTTFLGDAVRSDLEMEQIIASFQIDELTDPHTLSLRNVAKIPDMVSVHLPDRTPKEEDDIEDEEGALAEPMGVFKFDDTNGLVLDPPAFYAHRSGIYDWTDEEKETYMEQYATNPKQFGLIAEHLPHKTAAQCVNFYYLHKKNLIDFRKVLVQYAPKRRRGARPKMAGEKQRGNALLTDIRRHDAEVKAPRVPASRGRKRGAPASTEGGRRRGRPPASVNSTPEPGDSIPGTGTGRRKVAKPRNAFVDGMPNMPVQKPIQTTFSAVHPKPVVFQFEPGSSTSSSYVLGRNGGFIS